MFGPTLGSDPSLGGDSNMEQSRSRAPTADGMAENKFFLAARAAPSGGMPFIKYRAV